MRRADGDNITGYQSDFAVTLEPMRELVTLEPMWELAPSSLIISSYCVLHSISSQQALPYPIILESGIEAGDQLAIAQRDQ